MERVILLCLLPFVLFGATIIDSVRILHSGRVILQRAIVANDSANLAFYLGETVSGTVACSTVLAETFSKVTIANDTIRAVKSFSPKERKLFLAGDKNQLSFNLMNFLELPEMSLVELTSFKRVTSDNREDLAIHAEKIAAGEGWELVITPPSVPFMIWGNPNRTKIPVITVELLSEQDLDDNSISWNRVPQIFVALAYLFFVMAMFYLIGRMRQAHRDAH